jgi:hypothetical protein
MFPQDLDVFFSFFYIPLLPIFTEKEDDGVPFFSVRFAVHLRRRIFPMPSKISAREEKARGRRNVQT